MKTNKVKLYIAMSLDGKIAKADGSVAWLDELPAPEAGEDYGYNDFYQSIGITLMGNATYRQVLGFGMDFPYTDKTNYVFTRDTSLTKDANVHYVSGDIAAFVHRLKAEADSDIWLVGGGQINTELLKHQLIDELQVFVMPIVLGEGIGLFEGLPSQTQLTLRTSNVYSTGVVSLIYDFAI